MADEDNLDELIAKALEQAGSASESAIEKNELALAKRRQSVLASLSQAQETSDERARQALERNISEQNRALEAWQSNDEANTFYIGLTMAGAISAGAYTAGVLDTLFEALDRHNQRFEDRRRAEAASADGTVSDDFADYPRHQVKLRVISGTSAGGVSAGLAVAGLIDARDPDVDTTGLQLTKRFDAKTMSSEGASYEYSYILKPLHYVWVDALDLHRTGAESFLSTGDLKDGVVVSALNSRHIDTAAQTALENIVWSGGKYRFLTEDLDLFLTTTNLQGVPYEVGFVAAEAGASKTHAMAQHSSIRHFRVSGLGTAQHVSPWLEAWCDKGIPLPLEPEKPIEFDPIDGQEAPLPNWGNWVKFKNAAIATGSFPVGLAPRVVEAKASDFGVPMHDQSTSGNAWPVDLLPAIPGLGATALARSDTRPRPVFSNNADGLPNPDMAVRYVAVDGGVANNEPFELARYTLRSAIDWDPEGAPPEPGEKFLKSNPRTAATADRAVLMVDPFPEGPTYSPLLAEQANAMRALIPAASKLVPALINQARFKPGELIQATDQNIHSRYLMSPSRREPGAQRPERFGAQAIASGSFGGFGGFFHKSFRAHDYMLGQINCRSFLKNHFTLTSNNDVLALPAEDRAQERDVLVVNAGPELYDEAIRPMVLPAWPRIGQKQLDPILDAAEVRVREVGAAVVQFSKAGLFRKIILGRVWKGLGPIDGLDQAVYGALKRIMISELIERDQHTEFRTRRDGGHERPLAEWERAVLVVLAESGTTPVPFRLPDTEREAAEAEGDSWADLVSVLDRFSGDDAAPSEKDLHGFLDAFAGDDNPRIWKAPARFAGDERYTLDLFKPKQPWISAVTAIGSRIKNSIFGR